MINRERCGFLPPRAWTWSSQSARFADLKHTNGNIAAGAIKPIVAETFPLAKAADALHFLIEDRPFGMVVLTI
jgi:NADPH:quinone reductase-like Zn-dependent oxidoreductase